MGEQWRELRRLYLFSILLCPNTPQNGLSESSSRIITNCYSLNVYVPPHSCAGNLIPKESILGGESSALMNGTSALRKEGQQSFLAPPAM